MKKKSLILYLFIFICFIDISLFSQQNYSRDFDIVIQDKEKKLPRSKSNDELITKYIEFNINSINYRNLNKQSLGMIIYDSKSVLNIRYSWSRGHLRQDKQPPYIGCPEISFKETVDNLIIKIPYQQVCYDAVTMYASRYFLKRGKYSVKIYYRYYSYEKNDLDTVYSNTIPLRVR